MVSPKRRRDAVAYLRRRHPVSERRACRVVGQHRSTQRYRAIEPEFERRLVKRMNEPAAVAACEREHGLQLFQRDRLR